MRRCVITPVDDPPLLIGLTSSYASESPVGVADATPAGALLPSALTARMVKAHSAPLARSVTVWEVVLASLPGMFLHAPQLPPHRTLNWYFVMAGSPGSGKS